MSVLTARKMKKPILQSAITGTKQVVISHCYEELDWLKNVQEDVVLYTKGRRPLPGAIFLPNHGREAHTYLYHVVTNYKKLADLTFFVHGWPFDHSPDFIERLRLPYWDTTPLTGFYRKGYHDHMKWAQKQQSHFGVNTTLFKCDCRGRPYGYFKVSSGVKRPMVWLWHELFGCKMPAKMEMLWVHAAQFVVPKARILSRPLAFYQKAMELVDHPVFIFNKFKPNHHNIGPWIYERLWLYIFGDSLIWPTHPSLR